MEETGAVRQSVLKYEAMVAEDGRVEVRVPLPPGSRVTVLVVPKATEPLDDLVASAQSSMGFWDNPLDDEDWNKPST